MTATPLPVSHETGWMNYMTLRRGRETNLLIRQSWPTFAILPICGVFHMLSDNGFWPVGVQQLDGVGTCIFGALKPLIQADLVRYGPS